MEECRASGLRVQETAKGFRVLGKDGGIVVVHCTPSDHRWIKNARSNLRRIGLR